jgi:hypothetical protein
VKLNLLCLTFINLVALKSFGQSCLPVQSVWTYCGSNCPGPDTSFETKHLWYYDSVGRLIKDSATTEDRSMSGMYTTEYYRYSNDSIFVDDLKGYKTIIVTNKGGYPVETYITYPTSSVSYQATYNDDGSLKKITCYSISLPDRKQASNRIIDSIIYQKGNIVSYRHSYTHDGEQIDWSVNYSYYTDKVNNRIFVPNDKIKGLNVWMNGFLHRIQPLCKNLIKSTSALKQTDNYEYDFDKSGNVTGMKKTTIDKVKAHSSQWKFDYSCK